MYDNVQLHVNLGSDGGVRSGTAAELQGGGVANWRVMSAVFRDLTEHRSKLKEALKDAKPKPAMVSTTSESHTVRKWFQATCVAQLLRLIEHGGTVDMPHGSGKEVEHTLAAVAGRATASTIKTWKDLIKQIVEVRVGFRGITMRSLHANFHLQVLSPSAPGRGIELQRGTVMPGASVRTCDSVSTRSAGGGGGRPRIAASAGLATPAMPRAFADRDSRGSSGGSGGGTSTPVTPLSSSTYIS
jgi:hypothetical protein